MAKKSKSRKSKTSLLLIVGGIAVAGYFWLRSQMRLISFGGLSIPFQQIQGGNLNLKLRLPIVNASALAARVTGFTGFIVAPSGATVGSVFLAQPAVVQRYVKSELQFVAQVQLSAVLLEAGGLFAGGNLPGSWGEALQYLKGYKLVGQLRVYGLPLPLEMPLI